MYFFFHLLSLSFFISATQMKSLLRKQKSKSIRGEIFSDRKTKQNDETRENSIEKNRNEPMTNILDHHRDLSVQNPYYDVILVYNYDEDREVASSANETAIELDVCNLDNLIE